jgi:protein-disulfide isomerase
MKFYVVALSIYSALATVLLVLLVLQNRELKQAPARGQAPQVDYNTIHEVTLGDAPVQGPENAPITIVEFSDFQCPACARGKDVAIKLMNEYPGRIRMAYKHFPLPIHAEAKAAGCAAIAAQEQGKFWEMRDILFQVQQEFGEGAFTSAAQSIGLDMALFEETVAGEACMTRVEQDLEEGRAAGVAATPTYLINGIKVTGANYDQMKKVVEHWLNK